MSRSWSYRPGDSYAAVGATAVALVPAAHRSLALDLFDLLDRDAGLEELLDHVLQGGLSRLDTFALVVHRGDPPPRCCCAVTSRPS